MSEKYDPQPLIDATGGNLRALARRLNIDPALLCRPLTANQADKYSTTIGLHPSTIWGADAWWGGFPWGQIPEC